MESDHQQTRREQLKKAMRSNPDAVVDLMLNLEKRIEELEARLKMNSRNSSKPPSSDGLNKPSPKSLRQKGKHKSGGQPGHEGKTLEQVQNPDHSYELKLQCCPDSGAALDETQIIGTIRRQVFDLPSPKLEVTEYSAAVYLLDNGKQLHADFPRGVEGAVQYGFCFQAWLVHDFWPAYFKLLCQHAMCNQHIVRELSFFEEKYSWAASMKTLLLQACEDPLSNSFDQWQNAYLKILKAGKLEIGYKPEKPLKQRGRAAKPKELNLLERLDKHRGSVLAFIEYPEVPFTNNRAEQDVRMAKVKQKISGSFRSWTGAQLFASIRSYISTSIKQKQGVFETLRKAMQNQPLFS